MTLRALVLRQQRSCVATTRTPPRRVQDVIGGWRVLDRGVQACAKKRGVQPEEAGNTDVHNHTPPTASEPDAFPPVAPPPAPLPAPLVAVPGPASAEPKPDASWGTQAGASAETLAQATAEAPAPPPADAPAQGFSSDRPIAGNAFEVTAADVKAALLDSLYGTERGLATRNELRAEINELISQLEAKNPTPNPTEVMEKLDGEWRLIYTSSSGLVGVLALGRLPLVTVGDLLQKIDSASMTVENKVMLSGPLSKTEFTATANYEVRSPKRLQLKLSQGKVATPELTGDLELPGSVTVMGQFIDLSQLKDAVSPIKDQAQGLISQINQLMGQVPDLNVPITSEDAQTWQLTTYVDDDLRIARGDGGAVFIYARVAF